MLQGLTILVLFQTAGDLLQNLAGVPIPGSVIGMVLLLAALTYAKVPECVDLATGVIRCRSKVVYRIEISFEASKIRRG